MQTILIISTIVFVAYLAVIIAFPLPETKKEKNKRTNEKTPEFKHLECRLRKAGVPDYAYYLGDNMSDCKVLNKTKNEKYEISYEEKEKKTVFGEFSDISEACEYFFELVGGNYAKD